MRNAGVSKGLLRRLEKLEAASKVERFDSIGIVCVGMGTAEDIPLKEVENKQILTIDQILDEDFAACPALPSRGNDTGVYQGKRVPVFA